MMTLLFLALPACGGGAAGEETEAVDFRDLYHDCVGCAMEAVVTCDQEGLEWEARLLCDYVPGGESTVEVLEPETVAGVKAVLEESGWRLEYEGDVLNAGALGEEAVSPALCLPRLMNALRDGWLLEENQETWNEVPWLRVAVDQTGTRNGRIVSTVWLRQDGGTPLRGEVAVDGETILTADFTSCTFYDTLEEDSP